TGSSRISRDDRPTADARASAGHGGGRGMLGTMTPPLQPLGAPDLLLMTRVVDFAALRHRGQRRKGAAEEPYFNHLAEVAFLVAQATEGRDPIVVLGALLHDTIEDTQTTADELEAAFGAEV